MTTWILGIDISKRKFDAALSMGEKFKTKAFPNTPSGHRALLEWLARYDADHVHACMEATGSYWEALATFLHDEGHRVSVVNPAQIHAFAKGLLTRTKTDRQDARLIARFCEAMKPGFWQPRPREERELFALIRRLDALKGMRDQERARLQEAHEAVADEIESHIEGLERAVRELEERIRDHIERHPGLRDKRDLLASIPGVGETTAHQILSRLSVLSLLGSAKQWAAYAGLSPGERSSGQRQAASSGMVRLGDARLRKALYFPAMVAKQHNPVFRSFAQRLRSNGKRPKQIVVACMRKLLHIMYGVLKSGQCFDPSCYGMPAHTIFEMRVARTN